MFLGPFCLLAALTLTSATDQPTLADAQRLFYNAQYEAAAAVTLARRSADTPNLANDELRSSALLFELRGLLEDRGDKEKALKSCAQCADVISQLLDEIHHGQDRARAALHANHDDNAALFFLGKIDLNYVWLQLGVLGHKTGWDEYWEARRSLDLVLARDPEFIRARLARSWIDYIVDTKMPWGTRWLLGGGDRKQALVEVRKAASADVDVFTHAEAEFALWDMCVRERKLTEATEVARHLAQEFPDNQEVAAFLSRAAQH